MRKLIDSPILDDDAPAAVLLKKYFKSCMDKETIEKQGLQPLHDILDEMGGWPVLKGSAWDEDAFQWTEAVYQNRKRGYSDSHMFSFSVSADVKNYSRRHISLGDTSLGLGRKYLIKGFNDSDVQAYYNFMVEMALLMGAEPERAKQEMESALRFEMMLANISLPAEERRNASKLYNKMTLDQLSQLAPTVPWVDYTNKLLEDAGHQVSSNESVNVNHPEFFKNLTGLLQVTPNRVLANYLLWRVVKGSVSQLNLAARDVRLKFYGQVYGVTEHKPRWKECLGSVLGKFTIGAGSLYVQNHFDQESKTSALRLVSDVHKEFDMMLQEVTWMDNVTRERAVEKSKTISYYIAYPDELLNDTLVGEFYENLTLSDDNFLRNKLNHSIFAVNYSYRKLRDPVDKKDWRRHSRAAVVNAFYNTVDNSITFPAGILQGGFYNNDRPQYLNYGAIGFVIGHEITHGFDDRGRQFNAEGELQEWWEPETRDRFLDSAQCIIEQYGNITVDRVDMQVNGIITQGENIADNGGIRIARRAYDRYQRGEGREPALPGLQQYTNEQMFWLGTVNTWCAVYKEERLRQLVLTDSHAPAFVRMNTALSNTAQFARDWQCPAGSAMNRVDRCGVW
ncbi:neprilysin-2-like [Pollicipes pollicipes]|uniref:neprilysin-2-like n=1 Tax=Pollicipes pollicipes TaxID=41117 RepID=UPI0018852685|nr:neprilysin-2-like [Pollicipes pollicipes]